VPDTAALADDTTAKELERRERDARRFERDSGRLEPEQRYRALLAILKMETDFLDLADKKARFALVIVGVLNAVAVVFVVRGGVELLPTAGAWALVVRAELAAYAVATVYYIWQAIESLRPRGTIGRPTAALPMQITPGESMRVVFHADIARRDRLQFRGLWDELRMDNLNTELADQLYMVSRINVEKYDALARLYRGVGAMTVLLTVLVVTVGSYQLLR
jgi:hypothetical protein